MEETNFSHKLLQIYVQGKGVMVKPAAHDGPSDPHLLGALVRPLPLRTRLPRLTDRVWQQAQRVTSETRLQKRTAAVVGSSSLFLIIHSGRRSQRLCPEDAQAAHTETQISTNSPSPRGLKSSKRQVSRLGRGLRLR